MFREQRRSYIYYSTVALMLAAVYFIQSSTPIIPAIFGVKPNPAFVLLIVFAMFGGEWAGIFGGLALGIATDVISAAPDGFNALFMMIVGLISALLSIYLFNRRLPAAMVLTGICSAAYYLALWLVEELPRGYDGVGFYLLRYSLPSAVYSFLFVFPFWFIIGTMSRQKRRSPKGNFLE